MRGGQPFARAAAQFALIQAAVLLAPLAQRDALNAIPVYRSRGKGRTAAHHVGGHLRVQRDATKRRNVLRNRKAHR